jgi:hypothetical protein
MGIGKYQQYKEDYVPQKLDIYIYILNTAKFKLKPAENEPIRLINLGYEQRV